MRSISIISIMLGCLVNPAFSATTIKTEAKWPLYSIVVLKAETDAKNPVTYVWKVKGPAGKRVKLLDGSNGAKLFTGPVGEYSVEVQGLRIADDGKTIISEEDEKTITIVGDSPEPTPVPPMPIPVPPDDELVKSLKTAYIKETSPDKAKHIIKHAELFATAAEWDFSELKTVGQLYQALIKAGQATLPQGVLAEVRKITGAQLKEAFSDSVDADLTSEHKTKAKELFKKLAKALVEAGK